MSLYFWLLLGSIAVPLLLSFDKRLHFYTQWKYVLPSIAIVAVLYISVDIHFTQQGFWGFNDRYISGVQLFHLPVEEILFFIVVPYASIFLHEAILEYFPQVKVGGESKYSTDWFSFGDESAGVGFQPAKNLHGLYFRQTTIDPDPRTCAKK